MMRGRIGNERGIMLGVVIISALVFSAAAVAVLQLSMSSGQVSARQEQRLRGRYAAEAGLVLAMQRLWVDDEYCGSSAPSVNGCTVDITMTDCVAKNNRQVRAKASCP